MYIVVQQWCEQGRQYASPKHGDDLSRFSQCDLNAASCSKKYQQMPRPGDVVFDSHRNNPAIWIVVEVSMLHALNQPRDELHSWFLISLFFWTHFITRTESPTGNVAAVGLCTLHEVRNEFPRFGIVSPLTTIHATKVSSGDRSRCVITYYYY